MTTDRIAAGAGWANVRDLPKGPNGFALCRFCGQECKPPRQTFCSGARAQFSREDGSAIKPGTGCVHEHCIRSDPGYVRKCVWARDRGQCALCPAAHGRRGAWDADHIVPVVEGGGGCGLDGYRTLCKVCHKAETSALVRRRARTRTEST